MSETPRLDRLPVFVRAGTILPRQPLVQSTAQTPVGALQLDVYPGADCAGTLYEDDGHSLAYTRRGYLRQAVRCALTPQGLSIDFAARDGNFAPWWTKIAITVHGWSRAASVRLAGKPIAATSDGVAKTITFQISAPRNAVGLRVTAQ